MTGSTRKGTPVTAAGRREVGGRDIAYGTSGNGRLKHKTFIDAEGWLRAWDHVEEKWVRVYKAK